MDTGKWLAVVGLAIIVLMALGLLHTGWRMWRGNEEFEAGGSLGHQLTNLVRRKRSQINADGQLVQRREGPHTSTFVRSSFDRAVTDRLKTLSWASVLSLDGS